MRAIEPATKSPRREFHKGTGPYNVVFQFDEEWHGVENCIAQHAETGQWYLGQSTWDGDATDWAVEDWRPVTVAEALEWYGRSMAYSDCSHGSIAKLALHAAQLLKGAKP